MPCRNSAGFYHVDRSTLAELGPFTRDSLLVRLSPFFLSRYPHEAKTFPLQLQPAVNTTVHKGEVVVLRARNFA